MAVAALGLALAIVATTTHAQITIDTVVIGNPGNANDTTGYGGVSSTFAIGKYEISIHQYTAFLNAVAATDTYGLYNTSMGTDLMIAGISRSGSSGSYTYSVVGSGNRPVTYVSWFDAARFANWMANGQPTGAQDNTTTENGAYTLLGAMSGLGYSKNAINPNTSATTTWWIPSDDEWYKAAYYDPTKGGSGGYWLFPTQSDSAPGNVVGSGANQANLNNGVYSVTQSAGLDSNQNYLTDAGAFSSSGSYYGTFDQGGNVGEWTDGVTGASRILRGGSWNIGANVLEATTRIADLPTTEDYHIGFRIASVPEPSTTGLLLIGGAGWLLWRRRK